MAPDLSAGVFKGDGSLPMWTSGKRVCVTKLLPGRVPGSTVDRLRAGSRARGRAAYTPTRSSGCTQTLRLWTGSLRGEALTCAGGQLPTESDSLAQGRTRTPDTRPRCDLANRRHERERKARDLVLATHREGYCDCSCRRVQCKSRPQGREAPSH